MESGWTEDFNYLNYKHEPGKGINVRPGEETDKSSYRLRFPKSYTQYSYCRPDGTPITNQQETIERNESMIGKLVTDDYSITCQTDKNGCVAIGNPYLSMLSVQSFFSENQNNVVSLTLDGKEYTGTNLASMEGARMYIKPAEAFIIKTNSVSQEITVKFSAKDTYDASSSTSSRTTAGKKALYLQAQSGGETTYASVWQYAGAGNGVNSKEDVAVMIDKKNMAAARVFTIAGNAALSIQSMNNLEKIPVGLIVNGKANVKLKLHTQNAGWMGWKLVDTESGKSYSLANGEVEINLGYTGSTLTRLYLQK